MGSPGLISHGLGAPLHARGCLPSRLASCPDEMGRSPPYGAPGRLPAPGQVLLSGLHKTLLSGPEGLPSAGRGLCQPPALPGEWLSLAHPPLGALQRMLPVQPCPPAVPSRAAPPPTALLGELCHPPAEVLMVLCPVLNYFPDCHRHVLASGAGCDPAEPDAAATAWGANGRSTPHVEFNYWLSSLTEYIG